MRVAWHARHRRRAGAFHRRRAALALRPPGLTMSLAAAALGARRKQGARGTIGELAIALLAGAPGAAGRAWATFSPIVLRILRRYLVRVRISRIFAGGLHPRCSRRIRELRDQGALRTFVLNICLGVAQNELRRRRVRRRLGLTRTGRAARASDCRRGLRGAAGARALPPAARRPRRRRPRAVRPPLRREDGAGRGRRRARLVAVEDEATTPACHRARHAPDAARSRARRIRHDNNEQQQQQRPEKGDER